jgi:ligand-binding sensor domain-containing protein/two-component sensor histidine kinase
MQREKKDFFCFLLPHLKFQLSSLCVFLFLLLMTISNAQEPFTRKISALEGLPTQVIYGLYVSKKGMLYLGTDKGLISFDGIRYEIFPFQNTLGVSLNSIQEDNDGTIWCKNFSNQVFKLKNGYLVEDATVKEVIEKSQENLVDYVVVNENLWVVTSQKVYKISKSNQYQCTFELQFPLSESVFTSVSYNPLKKELLVTDLNQLVKINESGASEMIKTPLGQKESVFFKDSFYFLVKGIQNELYNQNFEKFQLDASFKKKYFIKYSQTKQNLWLNSSDGVHRLNTKDRTVDATFLKGKKTTDVVEDHEGNIWISTLDEGLYMMPDTRLKKVDLSQNWYINVLATGSNQTILAGTNNGIVHQIDSKGVAVQSLSTQTSLEIESLLVDRNKIITSIGYFEIHSKKFHPVFLGKSIKPDDFGNYVCAFSSQACLIPQSLSGKPNVPSSFKDKKELIAPNDFFKQYTFRNKRSRSVHYSQLYKKYYIGFSDGLFYVDSLGSLTEIKTQENKVIVATEIQEDALGQIWVASSQQGLLKIKNTDVVKQIDSRKGLKSNFCKALRLDNEGVWIVNNEKVYFIDQKDHIKEVRFQLSLKGISIHDVLVAHDQVWLATNEGVIFFPRKHVFDHYFSNFEINSIEILGKKNEVLPLKLEFKDKNVTFLLNTNHYKSLGNYEIEFRLIGVDSQWRNQSALIRTMQYFSLAPGSYQFESRLRSDDLVSPIMTLPFEVEKPFWMRYWFLALLVLILILLMYLVYKVAVSKTNRKQKLKVQLALSQLTALRSQMNPHFMFNVLNAVQGLIYSNQKTKANEYLGAFSDLMRRTLDISDKSEVSIEHEINTIQLYIQLEKARFDDSDFEYVIEKPTEIDLNAYFLPTLIIQPFVENAIKHGLMHKKGLKKLSLKIKVDENQNWIFEIEDNGIGREASQKINQKIKRHQSFATQAISHRIEIINQISPKPIKIQYEDLYGSFQQPMGTKVVLIIPQKKQPYESHNH